LPQVDLKIKHMKKSKRIYRGISDTISSNFMEASMALVGCSGDNIIALILKRKATKTNSK